MSELLPCPFCGGEAELDRCPVSGGWFGYCGAGCGVGFGSHWHPNKDVAVEYWNRRSQPVCEWTVQRTTYKTGCGEISLGLYVPNYCPNCGGKVVTNED